MERWHGAHHYSNKVHLSLLFFLFFSIAVLIFAYFELDVRNFTYKNMPANPTPEVTSPTISPTKSIPNQVICTMEAKLCPDGSYVGRHGPNCEFDKCP